MKQNLSYKNIHIGAIATFYIIALFVRLISLYVVNKYPSIETNYALKVSAALATGLGPAIGALVAMFIFKRAHPQNDTGEHQYTMMIPFAFM